MGTKHNWKYAPVCGIYCGSCDLLNRQCQGCGYVDGKPFWTAEYGVKVCPLHDCCRNTRHLEHCGLCPDFPCQVFLDMRDPSVSDEEARKSLEARQSDLRRRKQIGTGAWLQEKQGGAPQHGL
ncbi:MAG: DUF3795 domain-containing protein [Dehalococcoidia bacterium]|nr:DUF3795 domain-containing protein [Dehalococcoidia bacterium]